uniref:Uncharacterized protein n=1 Tax=Aplanochytrium stocchinoi TaxID=215587 RepID=A0A6S8AE18_9STRA|mmetsp:Transcript_20053/g.24327  ORF Transcript_20053/g.24327 Transcript_20053/m.24327 type:complete len:474 (-) Transcript_20053:61-1482(-)
MPSFFLMIMKKKKGNANENETENMQTREHSKSVFFFPFSTKFSMKINRGRNRKANMNNISSSNKQAKSKTGDCLKALVNSISDCVDMLPSSKKIKQAASSYLSSPSRRKCVNCNISATDEVGLSSEDVDALASLEKSLGEFISTFDKMVYEMNATNYKPDMKLNEKRIIYLVYRFLKLDLPLRLLESLAVVTFESRKRICLIISELFHLQQSEEFPEVAVLVTKYCSPRSRMLVRTLVNLYAKEHLSLLCGSMLRSSLEYQIFYKETLTDDLYVMKTFFTTYMVSSCFDVVSDAFSTFKCILTQDPELVSSFLDINYDTVTQSVNGTLLSNNYVSIRWSLELLFDILLERRNHNFLMKYIRDKSNLVLIMQLMNVESPMISLSAYKIFKVFALNPRKTLEINNIMYRNSESLVAYIHHAYQVQMERADTNDQMPRSSERDQLLDVISKLERISAAENNSISVHTTQNNEILVS